MAEDREITIVIKGKNLTKGEFDAARKELAGFSDQTWKTKASTDTLAQGFKTLTSAFAIGNIVDRGVRSLFSFGLEAINAAGDLVDLRAATGASLEMLQRWGHVADQGGIQLENMTAAAFKLGAKISSGGGSVRESVERLGLAFSTIRALKPEDQLDQVLRAAERLGPSQERNAILVELFGAKGALALARVVEGYGQTADAAAVAGNRQVEALNRATDGWDALKKALSTGITERIGNIVAQFTNLAAGVDSLTKAEQQHYYMLVKTGGNAYDYLIDIAAKRAAAEKQALPLGAAVMQAQRDYAAELVKTLAQVNALDGPTRKQILAAQELGVSTDVLSDQYGLNEQALKMLGTQEREREASLKRHGAATTAAIAAEEKTLEAARAKFSDSITYFNTADNLGTTFKATIEELSFEVEELAGNTDIAAFAWVGFKQAVQQVTPEIETLGAKLKTSLMGTLESIPQTIASAFTGGGGFSGALKSIASQIGTTIGSGIGAAFGPLGEKIGGALGSMVTLLGGPLKKLFGIGINDEVKKANVEIDKIRQSLIATYGPMDQLEAKANTLGMSFKEAWGHQGQAGLAAFTSLADDFKRKWDELNLSVSSTRGELDGLITKGADLGYVFDQQGNLVSVSFEKMQTAAQKYGVDLAGLGPSFQGARLHASAEEIINDFTLLTKGGGDVGTILVGMKDEISKLVSDSIKFGTKIPENMRPWIRELQRTGQLTDENGDKIDDLTAIEFGDPIATQFETITTKIGEVVTKLGELVDKLNTTLAPAIDNVTRDRTMHIGFQVDDPPDLSRFRGDGESGGFARGTFGTMGIDFPNWGDGTRVTVHEREAIVPYEDRHETALRWLGGQPTGAPAAAGGGPINLYLAIDSAGRSRQLGEADRAQVQNWLYAGQLLVPQRNISQRAG